VTARLCWLVEAGWHGAVMELSMGQRKAVTRAIVRRYAGASKADKGRILDELCATTGWRRSHARKAMSPR
jgi:hypothetical protein